MKDTLAKETGTHAAQCHHMDWRTVPARLGTEHVEGPRDGKSLMADLRLAKGVSLESILFDAGTEPAPR